jgi:hypothetical protein
VGKATSIPRAKLLSSGWGGAARPRLTRGSRKKWRRSSGAGAGSVPPTSGRARADMRCREHAPLARAARDDGRGRGRGACASRSGQQALGNRLRPAAARLLGAPTDAQACGRRRKVQACAAFPLIGWGPRPRRWRARTKPVPHRWVGAKLAVKPAAAAPAAPAAAAAAAAAAPAAAVLAVAARARGPPAAQAASKTAGAGPRRWRAPPSRSRRPARWPVAGAGWSSSWPPRAPWRPLPPPG